MRAIAFRAVFVLAAVGASGCGNGPHAGAAAGTRSTVDTVRVAVAANFAAPHDTIARHFTAATGVAVVALVGSTGQLYAQISNGAPVDVFLSADTVRPAQLERDGAAVAGSRFTYAAGRLALYAPRQSGIIDGPVGLSATAIRHIAIADPAAAPYGEAAMRVLDRWGIASRVNARLVRGESIAQTFQFVASGAAEAGFVALSQVIRVPGARYYVVPDSLHDPIAQDAVLLKRATGGAAAARYVDYLKGADARAVIESFGYFVPAASGAAAANGRR